MTNHDLATEFKNAETYFNKIIGKHEKGFYETELLNIDLSPEATGVVAGLIDFEFSLENWGGLSPSFARTDGIVGRLQILQLQEENRLRFEQAKI